MIIQLTCTTWCPYAHSVRVLVLRLNSDRLAVYSCDHVKTAHGPVILLNIHLIEYSSY